jgi:small GTP-binding protein
MGCGVSVDPQRVLNRTVTFVGLDGSGKSEIAFRMVSNDLSAQYVPIPTAGVSYSEIPMGGSIFRIYDCGGVSKYRAQWEYFVEQSDAAVFVIDRSDKERMGRVREEITEIIAKCASREIPLLILVNKCDIKSNLTLRDFATITKIKESNVEHAIKECCGTTGDGVHSARDWLIQRIQTAAQKTTVTP